MTPLMKCGHSANATRSDGSPVCASCFGLSDDAVTVADMPDLTGRTAICSERAGRNGKSHTAEVPSSTDLAFFQHRPNELHDRYYCGCWGWD